MPTPHQLEKNKQIGYHKRLCMQFYCIALIGRTNTISNVHETLACKYFNSKNQITYPPKLKSVHIKFYSCENDVEHMVNRITISLLDSISFCFHTIENDGHTKLILLNILENLYARTANKAAAVQAIYHKCKIFGN